MEARVESLRVRLAAGARLGTWAAVSLLFLAGIETVWSLLAPRLAPTHGDWSAASAIVRKGFQRGDLLVAAPAWSDPLLRQHLGDLLPIAAAARMDDARFGRVWEVSQRGAVAEEARGQVVLDEATGRLRVRLFERPAPKVHYDFVSRWKDARVVTWNVASRSARPCSPAPENVGCPGGATLAPALVEVDTRIRRALLTAPQEGALLAVEFPAVPMGQELAVSTGLHDVWARKYGTGTVYLKVLVDDQPVIEAVTRNRSGWLPSRADTRAWAGKQARVRFEISSPSPSLRNFAFAAESRG